MEAAMFALSLHDGPASMATSIAAKAGFTD
jgi:hypothetical protein